MDNRLVQKQFAVGAGCGLIWGVLAAAYWAAMFGDLLPAPNEIGMPFVLLLALTLVPLIVASGIEPIVGRSSPSLEEHLAATVACGLGLGLALTWLIMLAGRGARRA